MAGVISKSCENPRSFFRWSMDSCPEFLMRTFFLPNILETQKTIFWNLILTILHGKMVLRLAKTIIDMCFFTKSLDDDTINRIWLLTYFLISQSLNYDQFPLLYVWARLTLSVALSNFMWGIFCVSFYDWSSCFEVSRQAKILTSRGVRLGAYLSRTIVNLFQTSSGNLKNIVIKQNSSA